MGSINHMNDNVILVDKNDFEIDVMPKLEAHQKGVLHRAFSIFVFNSEGKFLMQQRALEKYHSPGLWSNTCCSHPLPGEKIEAGASRRLLEEMGISCGLKTVFSFVYKVEMDNGLIEHEYDHVLFGYFDDAPEINTQEVQNWKYVSVEELEIDMISNPQNYTEWLKLCIEKVKEHMGYSKMKKRLKL